MSDIIVGIDLGTTNSEVAILQAGKVIVIEESGDKILPSVVSLSEQGELLVGSAAKNQQLLYPDRTIASVKRKMGSDEKIQLGEKAYLPQEISAMILKKLKQRAANYLNQAVEKAVITVPAYFSDQQRQATREAGQLAGLQVERIINEPTAAALAYNADHQTEKKVLVYDLGGGTFDVSIVSIASGIVEVIASHGNNHLGGDDFDEKIVQFIVRHLYDTHNKLDLSTSPKAMARIKRAAETAKIHLSNHPYCKIEEEYVFEQNGHPIHLSLELDRANYEEMIHGFIEETMDAVHIALRDAKLMTADIDEVLLVGGSTRTPLIEKTLTGVFQDRPRGEVHPDLCVAAGAAIQAGTIAGQAATTVLVDVTPYSFGTSAVGLLDDALSPDLYVPIIKKNTPIPVTKSEVFATMHDFQDTVEVKVFQGEHQDVNHNNLIGDFQLTGLRKIASANEVIAKFHLDVNGILQVSAEEKVTGKSQSITITNALRSTLDGEIDKRKKEIDALFAEIEVGKEEVLDGHHVDVAALLKKAELLLETVDDADKVDLVDLIESIRDHQSTNNKAALEQAAQELNDLTYYLESATA